MEMLYQIIEFENYIFNNLGLPKGKIDVYYRRLRKSFRLISFKEMDFQTALKPNLDYYIFHN